MVVLDLLTRADALAEAAAVAIESGDHDRLIAVLDDRHEVIAGAITVWQETPAALRSPELAAQVAKAAQASVVSGQAACGAALRAREQVVAELSAFDARQTASQEYQTHDAPRASINVVL
jgi:phosphopantetheine adenylyltransferase